MSFMLFFVVGIFANSYAQENTDVLKSFINKNDIAVRSVQKYSINLTGPSSESTVKELLMLQIASVNSYNSDPKTSSNIAYLVREKCSDFLTKNSKGSLDYLKLSEKERKFFSNVKPVEESNTYLNNTERQKIESINVKDPMIFDNLNTRIK